LGGLIAEVRIQIQASRERRRALRKLLYELLELRIRIEANDPRAIMAPFMSRLRERMAATGTPLEPSTAEEEQKLGQLVSAMAADLLGPSVEDQYTQAVNELAPYDPLLAYYLRGQQRIPAINDVVRKNVQGLADDTATPENRASLGEFGGRVAAAAQQPINGSFDERVLEVARAISVGTARKVRKLMKERARPWTAIEIDEKIDRLIDAIPLGILTSKPVPNSTVSK
jgi:hypothetical protein